MTRWALCGGRHFRLSADATTLTEMPKRSRKPPRDENQAAKSVADRLIARTEGAPAPKKRKNPAAVALGRKGGLKGVHARAAAMTPEQRAESARKAAMSRWEARSAE